MTYNRLRNIQTVVESQGHLDAGQFELQMWDSRYMLKEEKPESPAPCLRPSCFPVLILLLMISAVIIVPIIQEKYRIHDGIKCDNMPDNNRCIQCSYVVTQNYGQNDSNYYKGKVTVFQSWLDLIKLSKSNLNIISSNLNLTHNGSFGDQGRIIFDELQRAGKVRGVEIKIILNVQSANTVDEDELGALTNSGIKITKRVVKQGYSQNTELWLADDLHVYLGSTGLDWISLSKHDGLGMTVHNCSCIAQDINRFFKEYWKKSETFDNTTKDGCTEFNHNISSPMNIKFNSIEECHFYVAISPSTSCHSGRSSAIDSLISVIDGANQFIYIAITNYLPLILNDKAHKLWLLIDDKLRQAVYDRQINVKILVNYGNHSSPVMIPFLRSLSALKAGNMSINVKLFQTREFSNYSSHFKDSRSHNRYMVTEKSVYYGMPNWSGDSLVMDKGLSVIFQKVHKNKDLDIRIQLESTFLRDWNSKSSVSLEKVH